MTPFNALPHPNFVLKLGQTPNFIPNDIFSFFFINKTAKKFGFYIVLQRNAIICDFCGGGGALRRKRVKAPFARLVPAIFVFSAPKNPYIPKMALSSTIVQKHCFFALIRLTIASIMYINTEDLRVSEGRGGPKEPL